MSKELLKRAELLDNELDFLKRNKEILSWCLSEQVVERSSYLKFLPKTSLKEDTVTICLDSNEFKRVAFLLNEMNEKKLVSKQNEFDSLFSRK